jgi:ribosomal protein S18 acetylase RimI-like enzyme
VAEIRVYRTDDEQAVIALWEACGLTRPWNVPTLDIQRKQDFQPDLFLVAEDEDRHIIGSVMAGYEGHRGWINYLAVEPKLQRGGLGRQLMEHAEKKLEAIGCPKINLQVRTTNKEALAFYERLGFQVDEAVSLGKRLDGLSAR